MLPVIYSLKDGEVGTYVYEMTSLFLPTESKHKRARETMLRYNEAVIKSSQARQPVVSDKDFNEKRQ